jgi:hypothetical protein
MCDSMASDVDFGKIKVIPVKNEVTERMKNVR